MDNGLQSESRGTRGSALGARMRSFYHAGHGIRWMVASQPNARIHVVATVVAAGCGLYCRLSALEWSAILLSIGLVWVAEALNTALEFLADALRPSHDPLVGKAKDVAAGAVLLAAAAAVAVGLITFGHHLPR